MSDPATQHLAIVIPTVVGREQQLHRCYGAFRQVAPLAQAFVLRDRPTCGEAWNQGADAAQGWFAEQGRTLRWLCFAADDLIPEPGCFDDALWFADQGKLPAPVLLNEDGSVWNPQERPGELAPFPRVPLMSVDTWERLGPVPTVDGQSLHYYSDVWFGRHGDECPVVSSYRFTHLWAGPGRIRDSEPDRVRYEKALAAE